MSTAIVSAPRPLVQSPKVIDRRNHVDRIVADWLLRKDADLFGFPFRDLLVDCRRKAATTEDDSDDAEYVARDLFAAEIEDPAIQAIQAEPADDLIDTARAIMLGKINWGTVADYMAGVLTPAEITRREREAKRFEEEMLEASLADHASEYTPDPVAQVADIDLRSEGFVTEPHYSEEQFDLIGDERAQMPRNRCSC